MLEEFVDLLSGKVADLVIEKSISPRNESETPESEEVYFTLKEFCSKLRISIPTYYRHKAAGYVRPAAYIGRKPLFSQASIDEYIKNFEV